MKNKKQLTGAGGWLVSSNPSQEGSYALSKNVRTNTLGSIPIKNSCKSEAGDNNLNRSKNGGKK